MSVAEKCYLLPFLPLGPLEREMVTDDEGEKFCVMYDFPEDVAVMCPGEDCNDYDVVSFAASEELEEAEHVWLLLHCTFHQVSCHAFAEKEAAIAACDEDQRDYLRHNGFFYLDSYYVEGLDPTDVEYLLLKKVKLDHHVYDTLEDCW